MLLPPRGLDDARPTSCLQTTTERRTEVRIYHPGRTHITL
jgi:hypothetical protein